MRRWAQWGNLVLVTGRSFVFRRPVTCDPMIYGLRNLSTPP